MAPSLFAESKIKSSKQIGCVKSGVRMCRDGARKEAGGKFSRFFIAASDSRKFLAARVKWL